MQYEVQGTPKIWLLSTGLKAINIFLLPNKMPRKLDIFWKKAFDNYPHMCVYFISKYEEIWKIIFFPIV